MTGRHTATLPVLELNSIIYKLVLEWFKIIQSTKYWGTILYTCDNLSYKTSRN